MKNHHGFVLLSVLLFIQIYALLGISALEQVFLERKILSDQKTRRLLLHEAEKHLSRLATAIQEVAQACLIARLTPSRLRSRPLSWWSASACSESDQRYRVYYVVESLGVDPCAQIRGESPSQAAYSRLTLLLTPQADEGHKVLLQTTVVSRSSNLEHCDSRPHSVDLGPQSWHELIEL